MSDKKTLEQIRDQHADQYAKDVATDSERFFMTLAYIRGFDASTAIHQERTKKLVEALEFYAKSENIYFNNFQLTEGKFNMPCGTKAKQALQECEEHE